MLAYHPPAEAVYGRDIRAVQQCRLLTQSGSLLAAQSRLLLHLNQTSSDSLLHLTRRRPGKCHHQQLIRVYRIIDIAQSSGDALGEHGSLAAACGCGYQYPVSAQIYRKLLLFRPFIRHAHCSPFLRSPGSFACSSAAGSGLNASLSSAVVEACPSSSLSSVFSPSTIFHACSSFIFKGDL